MSNEQTGWVASIIGTILFVIVVVFWNDIRANHPSQKQPTMAEVIKNAPNADGSAPKALVEQLENDMMKKMVDKAETFGDISWMPIYRNGNPGYCRAPHRTILCQIAIFKKKHQELEVTDWLIDVEEGRFQSARGIYINHRPKPINKPAEAVKK